MSEEPLCSNRVLTMIVGGWIAATALAILAPVARDLAFPSERFWTCMEGKKLPSHGRCPTQCLGEVVNASFKSWGLQCVDPKAPQDVQAIACDCQALVPNYINEATDCCGQSAKLRKEEKALYLCDKPTDASSKLAGMFREICTDRTAVERYTPFVDGHRPTAAPKDDDASTGPGPVFWLTLVVVCALAIVWVFFAWRRRRAANDANDETYRQMEETQEEDEEGWGCVVS